MILRVSKPIVSAAALFIVVLGTSACTGTTAAPEYYGDIETFVQTECLSCHRTGGIAPVPMETYEQVAAAAERMVIRIESGTMPPWNPADDCEPISDDRHLSSEEIERFVAWVDADMSAGDEAASTEPPPTDTLSDADIEVGFGVDYTPNDQGRADDYHCFMLDPQLGSDVFVTAMETLPGVQRMVHHVLYYAADRAAVQAVDDAEAGPGWTCFGGPGNFETTMLGGWVPGMGVLHYPEGTGIGMSADQVIVAQYHYNFDTGPAVADRSGVRLKTAPDVGRPATITSVIKSDFAIPPGAEGYSAQAEFGPINNGDGNGIWAVAPHMHQLGRSVRVGLTRGSQDRCLIDIPEWDFNWQQFYFFEDPVPLRNGDISYLRCTWDNPGTETVTWGEGTSDEMCIVYAYVTAL